MADETHEQESSVHDTGNDSLTLGFAFLAGLGMTLMMVAAGVGVIQGAAADDAVIGLLFAAGAAGFIGGLGAWIAVRQPWQHFDDINVAQYHGHAHHDADDHAPMLEAPDGEDAPALPSSTH